VEQSRNFRNQSERRQNYRTILFKTITLRTSNFIYQFTLQVYITRLHYQFTLPVLHYQFTLQVYITRLHYQFTLPNNCIFLCGNKIRSSVEQVPFQTFPKWAFRRFRTGSTTQPATVPLRSDEQQYKAVCAADETAVMQTFSDRCKFELANCMSTGGE
jgi:hypothetical protein